MIKKNDEIVATINRCMEKLFLVEKIYMISPVINEYVNRWLLA